MSEEKKTNAIGAAFQKLQENIFERFDIIEERLNTIEGRMDTIDSRLGEIIVIVSENQSSINKANSTLSTVERSRTKSAKNTSIGGGNTKSFAHTSRLWLRDEMEKNYEATVEKYFANTDVREKVAEITENAINDRDKNQKIFKYIWLVVEEQDLRNTIRNDWKAAKKEFETN